MIWSRGVFSNDRPRAPRGHRAYAIGDVHGRLDLLEELLKSIEADDSGRRPARTSILFLGDLIDRGPSSAQIIDHLIGYRPDFATLHFLMGNHEEVLLRVVEGEDGLLKQWLGFGGAECARSYGLDPAALRGQPAEQASEALRQTIPQSHLDFIGAMVDSVSFGSYLFVHAGIRPGVAIGAQSQRDLRWIRHPFLDDDRNHGSVIVHGHSITEEVEVRPNRIGIDTGAWASGRLTAIGLEGSDRWFLQTGEPAQQGPGSRVAKLEEAH